MSSDKRMDALLARATGRGAIAMAIVHPTSALAIGAADEAFRAGLIEPVLVGPMKRIDAAADEAGVDLDGWMCVDVELCLFHEGEA